ncbi:MAG: hypothetical protein H7Z39_16345 [Burkholderiaceae bacterium]|nr:hypothetical protein [Burkholderiaceae bacterium]
MRIPSKNSRAARVLHLLYSTSSCPVELAAGRHAEFCLTPGAIHHIYECLVAAGCAELRDGVYSISRQARRYFDQLAQPAPKPGIMAGPAYRPEPKPLDVGRMRMVVTREGAHDYRCVPSLVGGARVPFKGVVSGVGVAND